MSTITIRDLEQRRELDRSALCAVRGGAGLPADLGRFANVNIAINQNIEQLQNVQVNALNNVGVIGAGFVAPHLNVSPNQFAATGAVL